MRVSVDLDGTCFAYPALFRALQAGLRAQGHQVGILTAHGAAQQAHDLAWCAAQGFAPWDFLIYLGIPDRPQAAAAKAWWIVHNDIVVHFDDDAPAIRAVLRQWGWDAPRRAVFTSPWGS
jgi:hypothetical protein